MDVKETIKQSYFTLAAAFLERAKDGKTFVCPACGRGGNGSKHRDGLKLGDGGVFGCFSCHAKGGDIIDLYQLKTGVDYKTAINELGAMAGYLPKVEPPKTDKKTPEQVRAEFRQLGFAPMQEDYRGISKDILNQYGVKNCQQFKNPLRAGTFYGARQAVVFPTSGGNYFVRAYEHKATERCDKWDIGDKVPFNLQALKSGRPVFVVEGVIDALSIIQAGGQAIGLSGTNGIGGLVAALKETPSPMGLLLAADNDEAGTKASAEWLRELKKIGVECEVVDTYRLFGGKGDANEALQADKDGFRQRIAELYTSKAGVINPWAAGITKLYKSIEAGDYVPTHTGIPCIDKITAGGLRPKQLVVIGAPPAMGKTAICQWLVENMAEKKKDFSAMYFCYEMAREQMQARGASRLFHQEGGTLSALDILDGRLNWRECIALYDKKIANKVAYIGLGSGLMSSDLKELVRKIQDGVKYQASMGHPAPLIVVDYLQLVTAGRKDETEDLKVIMGELKRIAVQYSTTVIAVVANNRESNKAGGVSMYAGRGGSSIEYGADMTFGLAYTEEVDGVDVMHKERRSLVMTKGRFYSSDSRVDFVFNGRYSDFEPLEDSGAKPVSKKEAADIESLLNI
jgi:replicative DNA helicase